MDGLGLECDVSVEEQEGLLRGCLEGEDVGLLIGRRGQTIDAVQHLAQRIVFHGGESKTRSWSTPMGIASGRAQTLREDADDAAEEALRVGEAVELDPMPAVGAAGGARTPARPWGCAHPQRGRGA